MCVMPGWQIRMKKDVHCMVKPLVPVAVNDTPTEKELAAAKAARIRLGYEESDDPTYTIDQVSNRRRHIFIGQGMSLTWRRPKWS